MLAIRDLFEAHLTVSNLGRAVDFYIRVLGLPIARKFPQRGVAFLWIGAPGKAMLGLWEAGSGPQKMTLHVAFEASVEQVLDAPRLFRQLSVIPLDFDSRPTDEPVVLAWMPAVAIYFHDPDGNLLELISMLPQAPDPDAGIVTWSAWSRSA
jgi:lactoylglutathione lyase